jgi:putative ABC transport system permease protein
MTLSTFIGRSLWYYARSHLGTFLGVAVGSAILTGALLVGDSVRGSLRDLALARLGRIDLAVASGDRFFRSALAHELAPRLTGSTVVPALQLEATASTPDESGRANRVRVLGVDERFWRLAEIEPAFASPDSDEVLLNERLARQLGVNAGDTVLVRVAQPSALSRETPLSPQEDSTVALRLTVCGVVPEAVLGSFSLQPSQIPPFNAFVHLGTLQQRLDLDGRANLLLAGGVGVTTEAANAALRDAWRLADAELELRLLESSGELELRTSRVFLEPSTIQAALRLRADARPLLTYFVNEIVRDGESTPYSMVTAAGPPWVPADLGADEVVLNEWLAADLNAKPGDEIQLRYHTLGIARRLHELHATFRVRSVVPLAGAASDRELMPQFPGIERAESTRDWDASLPISMGRIRPQDEAYWQDYRGTPKAFVSLLAGQTLWTNRFGQLTAIRYPVSTPEPGTERDRLAQALLSELEPPQYGMQFQPVREQALASAAQSQDFGGLFLRFSFFLILAALLLVALLFQFGVEQRRTEIGTLLAVGFRARQVRGLLLGEGIVLAVLGSAVGLLGGAVYARGMIQGLATLWRDAVGTSALAYHASNSSLLLGAVAGAGVGIITIALTLRRQAQRPARELLSGSEEPDARAPDETGAAVGRRATAWRSRLAIIAALAGLALVGQALVRGDTASAGVFFGAGTLCLAAGLLGAARGLHSLGSRASARRLSVFSLGLRNTTRRRGRSLAVLALLACGSFLVAAIGVFRLDAVQDAHRRGSGTGGFALIGEATFPVVQDLNTPDGWDFFALNAGDLEGVSFVPLRVRDGDEASCLNLNRARQPRLLGVDPNLLAQRGAFTFARVARDLDPAEGWSLLRPKAASDNAPDEIPAVGDLNSILWAMGRKVGDRLTFVDERGRAFQVRIVGGVANSILQGNLVIDEAAFLSRFPSEPGYRMFLVDAPAPAVNPVRTSLTRGLRAAGVEFTGTAERLAAFNAVQNTYLGTFQLLGGLGLVLGSIGLGILVLRNVLERRGELGLLRAVGFQPRTVRRMVVVEHAGLLVAGLGLGVAAAAVAVAPNVLSPSADVPYLTLTLTLGGVLVSGFVWTWVATIAALRGPLLESLRNE